MSFLHVIAPYSGSSSRAMIGLMKLVTQRLPKEHSLLVLGDADEAAVFRRQGLTVLGSVQGTANNSRTLGTRLRRAVEAVSSKKDYLIAWGWTSAVAASGIDCLHKTIGYVDAIDTASTPTIELDCVIPTTWRCGERIQKNTSSSPEVTEPLVGIDAKTLVVESSSVFYGLDISPHAPMVAIVNERGKWQEIVDHVVQMNALGVRLMIVVPANYFYYSELHFALEEHGVSDSLRQVSGRLRLIDVVHTATYIWAPTTTPNVNLGGVLDLLSASSSGVPVAAAATHAITGVPIIGNRIAWVSSISDLTAWVLALLDNLSNTEDQVLEIAARVRAIASPAKFVEGLQLRFQ